MKRRSGRHFHNRTRSFDFKENFDGLPRSVKKVKKRCTSISSPAEFKRQMGKKKKDLSGVSTQLSFGNTSHGNCGNKGNSFLRMKRAERKAAKNKKKEKTERMRKAQEMSNNLSKYMMMYGRKLKPGMDVKDAILERMKMWIEGEIVRKELRKEDIAAERIKNWYFKMLPVYREFQKHWKQVSGYKSTTEIESTDDYSTEKEYYSSDPFCLDSPKENAMRFRDRFNNTGDILDSESDTDNESYFTDTDKDMSFRIIDPIRRELTPRGVRTEETTKECESTNNSFEFQNSPTINTYYSEEEKSDYLEAKKLLAEIGVEVDETKSFDMVENSEEITGRLKFLDISNLASSGEFEHELEEIKSNLQNMEKDLVVDEETPRENESDISHLGDHVVLGEVEELEDKVEVDRIEVTTSPTGEEVTTETKKVGNKKIKVITVKKVVHENKECCVIL